VARSADGRELPHAILAQLGGEGFLVVEGQERDERLLCRRDGLVDPTEFMRLPRLEDREHVLHADVQSVMATQVLRPLDDHARDPDAVGERLELDPLDPDRERDADLLPAFRPDLVRLHFLPTGRGGAHQVPGEQEVVEMPQVIRVLHAQLDLPRLRVAVEDAHRPRAMEGDRISGYRRRTGASR